MPKLIRFVIVNSLTGMLIGWLIAATFVWFNIGGFGELVLNSSQWMAAVFILALSFGTTFAFGFLATALILLPGDKDGFDRM